MASNRVWSLAVHAVEGWIMRRHPRRAEDWMTTVPNTLYDDLPGWLDASDHPIDRFNELLESGGCGPITFPIADRVPFFKQELVSFALALAQRADAQGCR